MGIFPDGGSPYGILDMSGNVQEWCLSAYQDGSNDPAGHSPRVLRGGDWDDEGLYARTHVRLERKPNHSSFYAGFRVVSPLLNAF